MEKCNDNDLISNVRTETSDEDKDSSEEKITPKKQRCGSPAEHIKVTHSRNLINLSETICSDINFERSDMLPGVSNPSQVSNDTDNEVANQAPQNPPSSEIPQNQPTQQNLQEDARHEEERLGSRRRGRRRGRRRRRGRQRARARARAREEARIALAIMGEGSGSATDNEDNDNAFADGTGSARSRSPQRQRSLDNQEFLRVGIAGIRPTATPPRLQPSPCRVPTCEWTGPLESAAQHARFAHRDAILEGPLQRLSVPLAFAAYTRYWRLIDAFDELFLVQFRRRAGARRRLQAAVQLVGPASRTASFLYLLHMQVVESSNETNLPGLNPQSPVDLIAPTCPSTTRISLVLGQTSSTRVDLEPAMISLWSAHNFSQLETSVENGSCGAPVLQSETTDGSSNTSVLRVLDLTVTIQRILGQKE